MHLLGIRSRTQVDAEVLEAADRLIAVGCFNVGTNQVDLNAARRDAAFRYSTRRSPTPAAWRNW